MQATQTTRQRGRPQGNAPSGGLGRAIGYLKKQGSSTWYAYGALFIATIAQLAVPQLVQNMIDAVTRGGIAHAILNKVPEAFQPQAAQKVGTTLEQLKLDNANAESLLINAALIIVAFAIMRAIFSFVQAFMAEKTSQGIAFDLRNAIFERVQRLSFSYYDRNQTGQLMIRATDDVEKVRTFIAQGLVLAAQSFLLLIGALVILAFTNWKLTL
ncbi:MAG: ABC transporter ATP-binding protein, partial [Herpetosiphon sp.]|nr:ABC transporter ATP-binding protein [Herpetosiphon sp.]